MSFQEDLREAADRAAQYRASVKARPVIPTLSPGEVKNALPASAPEEGESWDAIYGDFDQLILPGMTHWNHPRFFAYFPANNSEASIIAELLCATVGAQCMSWQTSPAATELEERVMDWLRQLVGLPETFSGVIQDTASSATLVAILMAREKATDFRFRSEGASAPNAGSLRVYASREAHSSIEKAVFLSGIGSRNLVSIDVDEHFALDPSDLEAKVAEDRSRGLVPAAVVATIGSTSSTAVDPLGRIAAFCRREGIFLHVDAAFAGCAAILPEMRWLLEGAEMADSVVFNPHKWLFTNFDCSAHFIRDPKALLATCAIDPEYLKTDHDEEVRNFRDWGIPLGRRFRALKLWFVIRRYGVGGLQERIRGGIALAAELAAKLRETPGFELLAPAPLGLVCFRHLGPSKDEAQREAFNQALLEAVNRSGKAYITHTRLDGIFTLRAQTAQEQTRLADVEALFDLIREKAADLLGKTPH